MNGKHDSNATAFWQPEKDIVDMRSLYYGPLSNPPANLSNVRDGYSSTESALSSQVRLAVQHAKPVAAKHVGTETSGYGFTNLHSGKAHMVMSSSEELFSCEKIFSLAFFLQRTVETLNTGARVCSPGKVGGIEIDVHRAKNVRGGNGAWRLITTVDMHALRASLLKKYRQDLQRTLKGLYRNRDKAYSQIVATTLKQGKLFAISNFCGSELAEFCRLACNADDTLKSAVLNQRTADPLHTPPVCNQLSAEAIQDDFENTADAFEPEPEVVSTPVQLTNESMSDESSESAIFVGDRDEGSRSDWSAVSDDETLDDIVDALESPITAVDVLPQKPDVAREWACVNGMPAGSVHRGQNGESFMQSTDADLLIKAVLHSKPRPTTSYSLIDLRAMANNPTMSTRDIRNMFVVVAGPRGPRTSVVFEELRSEEYMITTAVYPTFCAPAVVVPCLRLAK